METMRDLIQSQLQVTAVLQAYLLGRRSQILLILVLGRLPFRHCKIIVNAKQ